MAQDQFIALVKAELETEDLDKQIKSIGKDEKYKLKINIDKDHISKQIEAAIKGIKVSDTITSQINKGMRSAKVDTSALAKQLSDVYNFGDAKITRNIKKQLDEVFSELAHSWNGKRLDLSFANNLDVMFDGISDTIKTHAKTLTTDISEYQRVLDYFKKEKFFVHDSYYNSLNKADYGNLKKTFRGMLTRDKSKYSVNDKWFDLNQLFPDLFKMDIINPDDQLERVFDVIKEARAQIANAYKYTSEIAGSNIENDAAFSVHNVISQMGTEIESELKRISSNISSDQSINPSVTLDVHVDRDKIVSDIQSAINNIVPTPVIDVDLNINKKNFDNQLGDVSKDVSNNSKKKSNKNDKQSDEYRISDLDKEGRLYISKVRNTLNKQMPEIRSMINNKNNQWKKSDPNNQWKDWNVTGIEKANGLIKSLDIEVTQLDNTVKQLHFERAKIEGKKNEYLVQTDSAKIKKTSEKAQKEALAQEKAYQKQLNREIQRYENRRRSSEFNYTDDRSQNKLKIDANVTAYNRELDNLKVKIEALKNATPDMFENAKIEAEQAYQELRNVSKALRDSEKVATTLRTKDYDTVKEVYTSKLDEFESKIKASDVPIEQMQSTLDGLRSSLGKVFDKTSLTSYLNELDKANAEFRKLKTEVSSSNKQEKLGINKDVLESKITALSKYDSNISSFTTQINGAEVSIESLLVDLSKVGTQGDLSVLISKFNAFTESAKKAGYQVEDVADKLTSVSKKINNKNLDVDISKLSSRYDGLKQLGIKDDEVEKTYANVKRLQTAVSELNQKFKEGIATETDKSNLLSHYQELTSEINKFQNELSILGFKFNDTILKEKGLSKSKEIQAYCEKNTKALKKYGDQLRKLQEEFENVSSPEHYKKLVSQQNALKSTIVAEGLTGRSIFAQLTDAGKSIGSYVGVSSVIGTAVDAGRQMVVQTHAVDDAMTNLRMATGITREEAAALMETYADMGDKLKAASVDVAASSTEWLKQGKSIEEANKLTESSIILSKIGELSSEDATRTITAYMKAYDAGVDEVMTFVDQISAIDMESATDVGGLSTAFNEVAANARQAGVETEKVLAYAAAIGETTQESMSSVGTTLNAIFARMGNIKLSRLQDPESGEDLNYWGATA